MGLVQQTKKTSSMNAIIERFIIIIIIIDNWRWKMMTQ
jgi:hypothetical protein